MLSRYAGVSAPSTVVMAYTGHTEYSEQDPPTFIVVSRNDPIASASTMKARADAMQAVGVDVEYQEFQSVGHGFGLGTGTEAEGWVDDAVAFWETHMERLLSAKRPK